MTTCVVEQCKYVRAITGRATITIMVATTAHLVSSQSARKRTADPPAVPARLCHKISPRASPLAEAGNQSPFVAPPTLAGKCSHQFVCVMQS